MRLANPVDYLTVRPIGDLSAKFPESVITHVLDLITDREADVIGRAVLERHGIDVVLRLFGNFPSEEREELFWIVKDGGWYIAAGVLGYWPYDPVYGEIWTGNQPYVDSPDAAVIKAYQGRGIYKSVLYALRDMLKLPMESSQAMTAGSIRVWKHLPGVEVIERRGEPLYRWPLP